MNFFDDLPQFLKGDAWLGIPTSNHAVITLNPCVFFYISVVFPPVTYCLSTWYLFAALPDLPGLCMLLLAVPLLFTTAHSEASTVVIWRGRALAWQCSLQDHVTEAPEQFPEGKLC